MILASLLAVVVALIVTVVVARVLYRFSFKRGLLQSRKDYMINAVIVAFVFFCVSSIVYVTLINI
ncbi:hypothetical protein [Francisella adeliensis]|uniref:Uncharacterized protein n=1 Tax=Francisella adeliensis TaxID=2007306 RepID=A0A2Z4XZR0_9GAMM|nr:hypothetical protein [Francisella adeliensis]AXA34377.1 hypothetical protein CDH04_08205 [Francisella adeliensis]MBK2086468.1 hypothetical protein [Francisella adeliensis]MBK2096096.1 hypothetical protein [Francisella adeliensis]QIW12624.1 hypothetical protein FZC43_08210 [Francisella adeliensis]QIW14498.1 hypothetical protein FZC44_08205 [Francisella adeliensis]